MLQEDHLYYFGHFAKADWGNPQLIVIMTKVRAWKTILFTNTAEGYFRCIIRKSPDEEQWFWALEWNKTYRVFGAIAPPGIQPVVFTDLPALKWNQVGPDMRQRFEVPLAPEADTLFEHGIVGVTNLHEPSAKIDEATPALDATGPAATHPPALPTP